MPIRPVLALVSVFMAGSASGVPLVLDDGGTHVLAGTSDSVTVFNSSTASLVPGGHVQGDVRLGQGPALGQASSAHFSSTGGKVDGNVTTGPSGYPGGSFQAIDIDLNIAGSSQISGDVRVSAQNLAVTFADSASVNGSVILEGGGLSPNGTVQVRGGSFSSQFIVQTTTPYGLQSVDISGGNFAGHVNLADVDRKTISGGTFQSSVNLYGPGSGSTILGGTFLGRVDVQGPVVIYDGSFSRIELSLGDAEIFGGAFLGNVGFGSGVYDIFGGAFENGSTWFLDSPIPYSILNIYGYGLTLNGNWLTGHLSDGNFLSTFLRGTDFSRVNLFNSSVNVPEPTTLSLLGFGLAGVAFARRRRRFKSRSE